MSDLIINLPENIAENSMHKEREENFDQVSWNEKPMSLYILIFVTVFINQKLNKLTMH